MFTQCSNCNTVFELSADVLRAAGGQVRCGRCGEIFNALARLAEVASAFDTAGESPFDLEERADSILESVVAEQALEAAPNNYENEEDYGDVEVAQLQVLDFSDEDLAAEPETPDPYPEAALEFTLPPGELDRIFIESSVGIMPPFRPLESLEPIEIEIPHPEAAHLQALRAETARAAEVHVETAHPEALVDDDDGPVPDIEVISDERVTNDHALTAPLLSPVVELGAVDLSPPQARPAGSALLWSIAAIAAALLLVGQVVHHNRDALIARGPFAALLRTLYTKVGAPLGSAPNLAAFQLRQWGVTGEASGDPTLRVRASIMNTTSEMQPFPMLRVTLANRYGSTLGTRDFGPNEYAGTPIARLLSPGEKVDAVLNILDPGKDAEGFEIDVCLPGADKKLVCANDAAAAQARR